MPLNVASKHEVNTMADRMTPEQLADLNSGKPVTLSDSAPVQQKAQAATPEQKTIAGQINQDFMNKPIDTQRPPAGLSMPQATSPTTPPDFAAPAGIKVAQGVAGDQSIRKLVDAQGGTTYTNAKTYQDMQAGFAKGNVVPGLDKEAFERGNQAERELHAAKMATVHGGETADYLPGGRKAGSNDSGTFDVAGFIDTSRDGWRARSIAAEAMLRQQQITAQRSIAQSSNDAALQRQLAEQAFRLPGMQLDNAGKSNALAAQQQLSALQNRYTGLNDQNDASGAQRRSIAEQLLTLQGKEPKVDRHIVNQYGAPNENGESRIVGQALVVSDRSGIKSYGADGKPYGSSALQGEARKSAIADAQHILQNNKLPKEIVEQRLRSAGIDPKEAGIK